ncbi:MAG: hypothetical protein M3Z24_16725 [Chloroflexota bacterium]|nr:hypothetical protein [Chloroflexota bacterium]
MLESHICHLLNSTVLFCTRADHLGLPEALQHRSADIAVSNISELGGRR